jgi:hypothetical protein
MLAVTDIWRDAALTPSLPDLLSQPKGGQKCHSTIKQL